MAYTKQTWENLPSQTTPINADRLTHIEDGIFDAAATADTAASSASSAISGLADKVEKVEGKGLSTNDFTDTLKTKLDNIESGAEVNVQSDWNQSDNTADDYIKNKPTLGTASTKNSTSVVTDSTDLVESGAVYTALQGKVDNSVIAPVENGSTVQKSGGYAVGTHAIRNGAFITWKNAKAQGETINDASDYTSGDVASEFGLYISITNNAGFHNSIFRGKNLGSSLTTAQKTAIANGSFEDLYIGDYWEINSVKYRIAHFDYWLNCGDTQCTTHHVVVVPDSALVNKRMNAKVDNVDTTAGAYVNSEMRTTNLADAKTIVNAAFGADNILTYRDYIQNAVTNGYESNGAWFNADIELMSEIMVYGSNIFHNIKNGTAQPDNYTINKTQSALFRLDPSYITCKNVAQTSRSHWWLRDVVSATHFADVDSLGSAAYGGASFSLGVRPAFGIK